MHWGIPIRSEMQRWVMGPMREEAVTVNQTLTSELKGGGELVAPDATCSCCGKPAQASHHGAMCALREKRSSVCELKGLIHRTWEHFGIWATQLGHAVGLNTLPTEGNSSPSYRLWSCHGSITPRATSDFCESPAELPQVGVKGIHLSPMRWTAQLLLHSNEQAPGWEESCVNEL